MWMKQRNSPPNSERVSTSYETQHDDLCTLSDEGDGKELVSVVQSSFYSRAFMMSLARLFPLPSARLYSPLDTIRTFFIVDNRLPSSDKQICEVC